MLPRKFFSPEHPTFAALVLLIMTLVYTYPTIFQLSDHLIGGSDDAWICPWNNFNFRERILEGKDPYYTDYIFAPVGTSLLLHANTEFNSIVGLVLSPFINEVGQANIAILLATFLSGMGVYLLVRELTQNPVAALLAGIGFAFCPFRILRMAGHTNFATSQWLPLALWSFLRMGDTGRIRYALLTSIFFVLNFYSNQYYAVYITIAYLILLPFGWWRFPAWRNTRFIKQLVVTGFTAGLLLAPVGIRLFQEARQGVDYRIEPSKSLADRTAVELKDYFRPAPYHPITQHFANPQMLRTAHAKFTPGWVLMLLGLAGVYYSIRNKQYYIQAFAVLGLMFLFFSLGPKVEVGDFSIPLPYSLLRYIPFVNHVRIPSRFAVMVTLSLAVLAGYALTELRARKALVTAAILLLSFELFPAPIYMEAFHPPAIMYELRNQPDGVMLTLPLYVANAPASRPMSLQLAHHKPMFSGRTARGGPWEVEKYYDRIPILQHFSNMTATGPKESRALERDRLFAPYFRKFYGVRYLTVQPPFTNSTPVQEYIRDVFPDARLLSDEQGIYVYELPALNLDSFDFKQSQPGMQLFLFLNWEPSGHEGNRIYSCRRDHAQILLPHASDGESVLLELGIRSNDPRIIHGGKVEMLVNGSVMQEAPLKQEFGLWSVEIPGSELLKAKQLVSLRFVPAPDAGPADDSVSHAEIQSIRAVIRPK